MKRSTDRCHSLLIHVDGSTEERTHKPLKQKHVFLSFTATDFIKTKFEVDGALIELQIW